VAKYKFSPLQGPNFGKFSVEKGGRMKRLAVCAVLLSFVFAMDYGLWTMDCFSQDKDPGLAGYWKMDEGKYNRMLDEYYDLHGWDRETSFPKRETLVDLGLEDVANDLKKIGKLR
jgi:hypothetical protein